MQLCTSNAEFDCIQLNKDNVKEVMKFYGFNIDDLRHGHFVEVKDYGVECGVIGAYTAKIPYGYWMVYNEGYEIKSNADFNEQYTLLKTT